MSFHFGTTDSAIFNIGVAMKRKIKSLRNLFFLFKPYLEHGKMYIVFSLIISVVIAPINSLASVLFTQTVVDAVASGATFKTVFWIIIQFLLILLSTLLVQNAYDILYSERKLTEIYLKINSKIYERVLHTDYKFFDNPEFYNNYTWTINEYANKSRENWNKSDGSQFIISFLPERKPQISSLCKRVSNIVLYS